MRIPIISHVLEALDCLVQAKERQAYAEERMINELLAINYDLAAIRFEIQKLERRRKAHGRR